MKTPEEITAMIARLEDDIRERGYEASLDGACRALEWVLGNTPLDFEKYISSSLEKPEADRRREWIARGGDPADWE
ncbi:hypothetical protein ACQEVF_25230 [Nonomuraea polychroma]|uniref:hypothetical protein n=1 Tax=Nonomuraea polychroma TaxID=46176 RepID=UPI003D8E2280